MAEKKSTGGIRDIFEDVLGCKWSLHILELVRQGVFRPGAMERSIQGLTSKVLNERLKKLTHYGLLTREDFSEIPPRVEYRFTAFGVKMISILDQISQLEVER
jgi:DNA-binding HxlR family transcriptional regulator